MLCYTVDNNPSLSKQFSTLETVIVLIMLSISTTRVIKIKQVLQSELKPKRIEDIILSSLRTTLQRVTQEGWQS